MKANKINKYCQIKQVDGKQRIFEYIKNVWTVRKFFIDNLSGDLPIINGDQMPYIEARVLHRKLLT